MNYLAVKLWRGNKAEKSLEAGGGRGEAGGDLAEDL